jgi:hypothetical protein
MGGAGGFYQKAHLFGGFRAREPCILSGPSTSWFFEVSLGCSTKEALWQGLTQMRDKPIVSGIKCHRGTN